MRLMIGLVPLLLAATVSAAGKEAEAPADQLTFVKILTEGRPPGERADGIECVPVTSPYGPDELCTDWGVAIRIPFDAVQGVTLAREPLPRDLENIKRRMEGRPELPPTDIRVTHHSVLSIRFTDQAAAGLEALIQHHPGELLDLRIGKERLGAFTFKNQRVTPVLRLRFADDLTERLQRLFAPLGTRVTVRDE